MSNPFNLKPQEAINYFSSKGFRSTFSYADMFANEHAAAFTIAKMLDIDLLKDVKTALDASIDAGESLGQFRNKIEDTLRRRGWWGRQAMIDPDTGDLIEVELGSPRRIELIYRTNIQSAYAAGEWQSIENGKEVQDVLLYDAVDDGRTRPDHAGWDDVVLPVDDPFWSTNFPPNGYNCRCSVIPLDSDELAELGIEPAGEIEQSDREWVNPRTGEKRLIPNGIDPGFDLNPGKFRRQFLDDLIAEKAFDIDDNMKNAVIEWLKEERRRRRREGLSTKGIQKAITKIDKRVGKPAPAIKPKEKPKPKPKPEQVEKPVSEMTTAEIEKKIYSLGFKGYVDFGKMDVSQVRQVGESIINHFEQFPALAKEIGFLGSIQASNRIIYERSLKYWVGELERLYPDDKNKLIQRAKRYAKKPRAPSRTYALARKKASSYLYGGLDGVHFNESYTKKSQLSKMKRGLENDVSAGFHPPATASFKAVSDHELGHSLDYMIGIRQDRIINEMYSEFMAGDPSKLSRYARENIAEFIAEAWSEYVNNKPPRAIAKAVGDRILRLYEENKRRLEG